MAEFNYTQSKSVRRCNLPEKLPRTRARQLLKDPSRLVESDKAASL
jgi:hypothetical protein